jgi:antitoxin FitA
VEAAESWHDIVAEELISLTSEAPMAAITIRNLSDETHRALKTRAKSHQRSTEAEVRSILDAAVATPHRAKIGSLLAAIGHSVGGAELDVTRDQTNHEPLELA